MRVKIHKPRYLTILAIARVLFFWDRNDHEKMLDHDDTLRKIPGVLPFVHWFNKTFPTKEPVVKIDHWDTWNLDHTLATVILPCLKQFKSDDGGIGAIAPEDCPLEVSDECDWYSKTRCDWVIDEMIWSFGAIVDDSGKPSFTNGLEEYMTYQERITNGTRLFGKYYRSLWT